MKLFQRPARATFHALLALAGAGCGQAVGPGDAARPPQPDATAADAAAPVDAGRADAARDAPAPRDDGPVEAFCRDVPVDELRVPRVVRAGAGVPFAASGGPAGGCTCTPQLASRGGAAVLQRCECCDDCPCVDAPYLVNGDAPAPPPRVDAPVTVGERSALVQVVGADESCAGSTVRIDSVRVPDDAALVRGGPRRVWVEVRGTAFRCTGEPLPLVDARPGGDPIFLEPLDCNTFDCDGPTTPRPFTTWLALGELAPGPHSLFYSPGISYEFVVR